jgi:hypothetical protein
MGNGSGDTIRLDCLLELVQDPEMFVMCVKKKASKSRPTYIASLSLSLCLCLSLLCAKPRINQKRGL